MFFSRIDSDVVLHWCSEYVIPKEGPGTARDEGGIAGADARSSEGASLLPDLVILIEIEGVQWLETATCERGFSLRTQILTAQRHSMGDSLLACLMMICSNGPSLHEKEEVEKFLLAVVARFKAFKRRVPSRGCGVKPPQRASASKAKSSVLSQLSGLENVVFNVFIDDKLDSESGIMSQTQM